MTFQPAYSNSGSQVARANSSGRKAGIQPGLDAIPAQGTRTHTHTHTHSYWDNVDSAVHFACTSLKHGRKPEYPEKTPVGRICKLHTHSGPGRESFGFLINLM